MRRRSFLKRAAAAAGSLALGACATDRARTPGGPWFQISLAEWSLHRTIFGERLTNLDFPIAARREYGIGAVEYVNQFWMDKPKDTAYLRELRLRCNGEGVRSLLIMCDGLGALGDPVEARRRQAVENHYPWVAAAQFLGCHSVRVNAESAGSYDEQRDRAADGLRRLAEFAAGPGLNVIVENHGGLSSNGAWLAAVIQQVNRPNCGTLPDFGNFDLGAGQQYDRYRGVAEMMPFAKAVSAKSHDFDAAGNETQTDYWRMLRIVRDAGYRGYLGIEYEGDRLSEPEGIRATLRLLERVRAET